MVKTIKLSEKTEIKTVFLKTSCGSHLIAAIPESAVWVSGFPSTVEEAGASERGKSPPTWHVSKVCGLAQRD